MNEESTHESQAGDAQNLPDKAHALQLTTTHEGATAFVVDDPMVRLVFTYGSFLPGADTYYGTPEGMMLQFIDAVIQAGRAHAELALQYAAWLRDPRKGKGNRSQPPWVLAVLSSLPNCIAHPRFPELVARCIVRPDDALNIVQAATVYLGDNKLPAELKLGVARGLNAMSDYQLAKYANANLNLLPERKEKRPRNALPQPSESTTKQELVPGETTLEEQKSIPARTLRLVDVLGICKHELSPRLFAVYRYLHAPTRQQPSLLPMLQSHLPLVAEQKLLRANPPHEITEVENWLKRALAARMTMEQIFSATGMAAGEREQLRAFPALIEKALKDKMKQQAGLKDTATIGSTPEPDYELLERLRDHELKQRDIRAALWRTLSVARVANEEDGQKEVAFLGDMVFLRNVRDMFLSGLPVYDLVTEAKRRRFSGLWPFQLLSAADKLENGSTRGRGKYSAKPCPEVLPVLNAVFDRVALDMLPRRQDGTFYKILGLADVSGSMSVKIGSKNSSATCMDAALSFSVAFSRTTRTEEFGGLGGTWDNTFRPAIAGLDEPALSMVKMVKRSGGWGGGGTQVFGAIMSLINWLVEHPSVPRPETLVILSDMQFHAPTDLGPGELQVVPKRYQKMIQQPVFKRMPPLAAAIVLYRKVLGSDISLVLWNLAAYEGSPVPSNMQRVLMLSGFDTNSFPILEQWLRAGSPGRAMPTSPTTTQKEGGQSDSSFEAVLAALRAY